MPSAFDPASLDGLPPSRLIASDPLPLPVDDVAMGATYSAIFTRLVGLWLAQASPPPLQAGHATTPVDAQAAALRAQLSTLEAVAADDRADFRALGTPETSVHGWHFARERGSPHVLHVWADRQRGPIHLRAMRAGKLLCMALADGSVLVDASVPGRVVLETPTRAGNVLVIDVQPDLSADARVLGALPGGVAIALPPAPAMGWALATADPWLSEATRSLLQTTDLIDYLAAIGAPLRLAHTPQPDTFAALAAAILAGAPPQVAWVHAVADADWHVLNRLATERAHALCLALRTQLKEPEIDDPQWSRSMDSLLIGRDSLESAVGLLACVAPTPDLHAALAVLDALGEVAIAALSPWTHTHNEQLRRAALVAPDAWWVRPTQELWFGRQDGAFTEHAA